MAPAAIENSAQIAARSKQDGVAEAYYTFAEGRPVSDPTTSTILRGTHGRLSGGLSLLEDTGLIETLAHFPRERIPERVVHAKAAGAWGEFEVTHDISHITSCDFLTGIGKKTPLLARLSTVGGEKGSADTVRDIRGFAVKFFTQEGNQDFVMNDLPVFFIRDPILHGFDFPSMNRSHKKHPQTNVQDPTMWWDYHNNNQEGTHALMQVFGSRGVSESIYKSFVLLGLRVSAYRVTAGAPGVKFLTERLQRQTRAITDISLRPPQACGTSAHTACTPTNSESPKMGRSSQGNKTLSMEEAVRLAGEDPGQDVRDLFNSIANGNFPSWTVSIQVMDPKEAETVSYDIFDPIGKMTLNRNPSNYSQDVEQAAFSPSNMVPGIGPSADIMLQARMFSYPDAARYRVGPIYQLLPCNAARSKVYSPFQRDGPMRFDGNYGGDQDYVRSSFQPVKEIRNTNVPFNEWRGKVEAYTSQVEDDDFTQPKELWKLFKEQGVDEEFIHNVSGHMSSALPEVRDEAVRIWGKVDKEIEERINEKLTKTELKDVDPAHVWHKPS
ncbi:Putative catalase immune-responsive domain, catalase core domain, Catalase superfamily [Septoria linicola]|uniref:Catalase immune-responsive domain, catalase core domain, Catalase superfamily n=1 Tax=Septoria linicola TaxID=215465 RepID=A0A9Q9ARB4_9PEZI|nr:putative catalase immune-responsive domain, catalase core domain, Catalase superfamily [Septoria linicola]USW51115.1 Putative catalase immune-responsive domain, catalase core domain, Catalase superfamily [Septoria linicola]